MTHKPKSRPLICYDHMGLHGRTCNRIISHQTSTGNNTYDIGDVATPYGIVSCMAQGDESSFHYTRLDYVHRGRLYMCNINGRRLTKIGMARVAVKFARKIKQNHGIPKEKVSQRN